MSHAAAHTLAQPDATNTSCVSLFDTCVSLVCLAEILTDNAYEVRLVSMAALLLLAGTASSGQTQQCATTAPSFAKLFTYEDMGSYQRVTSTQCADEPPYILYPRGQAAPDLGPDYKYFGTPLEKVAVTQSVTITFLEMLGVRDKIIVASEYTSSACVAKKVADGDCQAMVQHRDDETAHAALMANGELDAIFSDPWYTGSWHHAPFAPKVVCEASTYEETPLGNGEWIKVCTALYTHLVRVGVRVRVRVRVRVKVRVSATSLSVHLCMRFGTSLFNL